MKNPNFKHSIEIEAALHPICLMNSFEQNDDERHERLIAAAPELYEQCKLFERTITELMMQGETGGYEELEKLRAVLAKIDGGEA